QALVGDPVDNVPGVPGVGVKTAAKLLKEYGTLEGLFANVDRISGAKTKENLRASADKVLLSRKLVRLATDVPLKMEWDAWRVRDWDTPRLTELFAEWGFRSLAARLKTASKTTVPAGGQQELFADEEQFPFGANVSNVPGDTG